MSTLITEPNPLKDSATQPDYIFIPDNYEYVKLKFNDILFLEADGSYTHIHTRNSTHQLSLNLKHLGEQLTSGPFLRISRKHLVNIDHISRINGVCLFVDDDHGKSYKLPFSKVRRQDILKELPVIKIS